MRRYLALLAPALPLLASCVTEPDGVEIDDVLDEAEAGKADADGAYRHYLLWAEPSTDDTGTRWIARAGGGPLRCPDAVVRDRCELLAEDFVPTPGLHELPEVVFDELNQHGMIARGRLVKSGDCVHLRASGLTRGITTVMPEGMCYRLRPQADYHFKLEQLDTSTVEEPQVMYFDDVDPDPDFWGQPTPATQAVIDDAVELARTRPVYGCGWMDCRDSGDLFWTNQVFAPKH